MIDTAPRIRLPLRSFTAFGRQPLFIRAFMDPANLITGGVQLVVAMFFLLVAVGVIPAGKTKEKSEANRLKFAWFWWLGFVCTTLLAIAKMFGVMG